MTLIAFGIITALAGVGYLVLREMSQARASTWREAAKAVGMTGLVEHGHLGMRTALEGRAGGLEVRLEAGGRGAAANGTRVSIGGLGHTFWEFPARFSIRAEGVGSVLSKALGGREVRVGDEAFDALAYVQGTPRTVLAILDAEARRLIGDLLKKRVELWGPEGRNLPRPQITLVDGVLQLDLPGSPGRPATADLSAAVREILALAQALARPEDVPSRLARNVRQDPTPGVRLANLITLLDQYPDAGVTREALPAACRDENDEVRVRAAVALGPGGADMVLREIASYPSGRFKSPTREPEADSRAERAIKALGTSLSVADAEAILDRSLVNGRIGAACAAIDVLGRLGGREVVPILAGALRAVDAKVAVAAARSLGQVEDGLAEAPLIAALKHPATSVQLAATMALGRIGTAAAVEPLQSLGRWGELRSAARQSIAEIQSRLTGATPGQLALADGDSGQLSLAEESREGRVSMASEADANAEDEIQWPTDEVGDPSLGEEEDDPPAAPIARKKETDSL